MEIIMLTLGDWSGDGNGKTSHYHYKINTSKDDLAHSFKEGCLRLNIADYCIVSDWGNKLDICSDYETNFIPQDFIDRIVATGLIPALTEHFDYTDPSQLEGCWSTKWKQNLKDKGLSFYSMYPELFAKFYMFICKMGNSALEYEEIKFNEFAIGGYGLFS